MARKVSIEKLADEVNDLLQDYADTTSDGVKNAVRRTGRQVRADIQSGAPVKSGDYKKSWMAKKVKENSNSLQLVVHSKNRYQLAHLLEHGHAKRNGGRTRAVSHIAPAEQSGIKMLESEIRRSIRNG